MTPSVQFAVGAQTAAVGADLKPALGRVFQQKGRFETCPYTVLCYDLIKFANSETGSSCT
jgi:hypothetical protein